MSTRPLTARQEEVLEFIMEFIDEEGFPPTRAELAEAMGFASPNAAEDHLKALERKGVLERLPGTSRGIRLLIEGARGELPVIGRVAAGRPILAEQNIERYFQVDKALFKPRAHYLLKVKGNSMRDAGIVDGDLLAVHRTPRAESGQIIVARVGDEVTVKRFRRRGSVVRLMPENEEFEPIVVDLREDEFAIEGVCVGVVRSSKKM